jgi:hypothetical protein
MKLTPTMVLSLNAGYVDTAGHVAMRVALTVMTLRPGGRCLYAVSLPMRHRSTGFVLIALVVFDDADEAAPR